MSSPILTTVSSLPVLSMILTCDLFLPALTWGLLLVNVKLISNLSLPSTILSHVSDILNDWLTSPAANVTAIGSELKSTPDPMIVQ